MNRPIIILVLFLSHLDHSAWAQYQFKHFQLTPTFEEKVHEQAELNEQRRKGLIAHENFDGPDERSPLFDEILKRLENNYKQIGQGQTDSILQFNRQFDFGQSNFLGLTWQEPMGSFHIGVNRNLVPDITDDKRWIVEDKLTITIDAITYLRQMQKQKAIEISDNDLGLFAGVSFKRIYRFYHFAPSYIEGLVSDFSKLFLSFIYFNPTQILKLPEYTRLSKEDYFSAEAGAFAQTPSFYGFAGQAGILAGYHQFGKVEINIVGQRDRAQPKEFLKISHEKKKGASVGAAASLVLDFYQLLKIDLLSFDLNYEYHEADRFDLSFFENNRQSLRDGELRTPFKKILALGKPDMTLLEPYLVSREARIEENLRMRYFVLLFGGVKSRDTEHIQVTKDGVTKTFFRHYSETIKYVKSFWRRLINSFLRVITRIAGIQLDATNSSKTRRLVMEFEEQRPQIGQPPKKEELFVKENQLSIQLSQEYTARKTRGLFKKRYRKHAVYFLKNFTNLPSQYPDSVKEHNLRGPLRISTIIRIGKDGLNYFNRLPDRSVLQVFFNLCEVSQRKRRKKGNRCSRNLFKKFQEYKELYFLKGEMKVWPFKDLLMAIQKRLDHLRPLFDLFGQENIFFNGTFSATTSEGKPFQTYFRGGNLKSLGVVEDFRNGRVVIGDAE